MSTPRPIRLGVIGLGLIWMRTHRPILAALPELFEPVAFCDVSEQRRQAAAREFPGAPVLADYRELLALPDVAAALVLTPIGLNAPVARAAVEAGKHVIMEKPIARSVAEGRALIAAARAAGRQLAVTEQMGYRRAEETLAGEIAAGAIGNMVLWERVMHLEGDTAQGALRYETTAWRKQPDFPLGTLFDGGIHTIAGLSRVFGAPRAVVATGQNLRPEYGEYDHVAALFEYASGAVGMLSHSTYLPPGRNHFHVHGTAGVLSVEQDRIVVERPDQPARVVHLPEERAYVAMWRAIGDAFRGRRPPGYTAEHALRDVAILEAVDRSIKTGARVAVAGVMPD